MRFRNDLPHLRRYLLNIFISNVFFPNDEE